MKKLLITMAATLVCVGAFGQGKLAFTTDSLHLVYFSTDTAKLNAGDSALAGRGLYTATIGSLAGTPSLVADLWAGSSALSLTKQATTTWSGVAEGRFTLANTTFATLPAGTAAFFQIQVHDSRAASALEAWAQNGWYAGESSVFTAVPQPATYSPIYQTTTPVFSTWALGTQQITGMAAGNFGTIQVFATIPEPGTFALAGLGLASLLIFRRRK